MSCCEIDNSIMVARHSLSHALAAGVLEVCKDAKLGIGPAIDNGFYYDFEFPENFKLNDESLEQISAEISKFIKQDYTFDYSSMSLDEARKLFEDQPYKLELIDRLESEGESEVGIYTSGPFKDLCKGPHVDNPKSLRSVAWKIDRLAGAYWMGDAKRPMLQRIYCLAFDSKKELRAYENLREEAKKRDHRVLGAELKLFTNSDLVGKGFPLIDANGYSIYRAIEQFVIDEELKRGYHHVKTPHVAKKRMYEMSGHWQLYQDSMYPPMDLNGEDYVLRPMTCPHHFMLFKDDLRSYRELPIRIAEVASQFRKELSGELSGLMRVMTFNLTDAHIFCRPNQLDDEFKAVIELVQYCAKVLGVDESMSYRLSLRDSSKDKYVDNDEMWELGESALRRILQDVGLEFTEAAGHAAFYGPKLDVQMKNVLGNEETVFTVQIDFCMPERFDLTYVNEEGEKERPVVIHRSSVGALERVVAFLTEFYGGSFPLWLAPVQTKILTVSEAQDEYANQLFSDLKNSLIRTEIDLRADKIGKKIREGRLQRIPYLVVIGKSEVEQNAVTVRNRDTGNQVVLSRKEFIDTLVLDSTRKNLTLSLAESTDTTD